MKILGWCSSFLLFILFPAGKSFMICMRGDGKSDGFIALTLTSIAVSLFATLLFAALFLFYIYLPILSKNDISKFLWIIPSVSWLIGWYLQKIAKSVHKKLQD